MDYISKAMIDNNDQIEIPVAIEIPDKTGA